MRIQHNIAAINSYRQLGSNNNAVGKNLEKLSSGFRINRAGDDAAGLAISEKMRAQIKGLETASKNANDGISLVQTAEGALTEVHSMLNRMTELATQSSNGTYDNTTDRANLQKEIESLKSEIDRIAESTNFNGIKLLDGSLGGGKSGTADGVSFTGGSIAKFAAAEIKGVKIATSLATADSSIDYFAVDGQKLEVDWTKGDAKNVADAIKAWDGTAGTEAAKDLADKLNNLFNDQIKEQGLTGSVKITSDGTNFILASENSGADSEFSYVGTNDTSKAVTAFGTLLFDADTNASAPGDAVKSVAKMTYNGETIAAKATFTMNINGVESKVEITAGLAKGDDLDSTLATTLEGYIQTAVGNYNTQMGLTPGTKDTDSGLTGLTTTDFTAEFSKDGELTIKYNGDVENVSFSFNDIGDKSIASSLGLASGSSSSNGGRGLSLQVGDTNDAYQKVNVSVGAMDTRALKISDVDISRQDNAGDAIAKIKDAINSVSSTRGDLGAIQNRLEHTINNLGVTQENMTAAESRVRDVDMAKEMMDFTKNNILTQAAQAMLAQANQLPQGVLQLLQ